MLRKESIEEDGGTMELTLRPALPKDAAAAAPLIFSAGPDAYNFVFSHRTRLDAQGFVVQAFHSDRGEFSWRHFRVAELDGEIVATAEGYTGAMAKKFLWPAVRQIIHCYGMPGALRVIKRGLQAERVIVPPTRADLFYIGNVAVSPALRGQGIGARMMDYMHAEAMGLGAKVCALDVSTANPRAEALYTRLGYRVVKENPSTLENAAGKVVSHRRMEMEL